MLLDSRISDCIMKKSEKKEWNAGATDRTIEILQGYDNDSKSFK